MNPPFWQYFAALHLEIRYYFLKKPKNIVGCTIAFTYSENFQIFINFINGRNFVSDCFGYTVLSFFTLIFFCPFYLRVLSPEPLCHFNHSILATTYVLEVFHLLLCIVGFDLSQLYYALKYLCIYFQACYICLTSQVERNLTFDCLFPSNHSWIF